jgi:hypothetical protein
MGREKAVRLAVASGVLLLLANAAGGSVLLAWGDEAAALLLPAEQAAWVSVLVGLLLYVAGLGGLAVLAGAKAWHLGQMPLGRLLVTLGAGTGLLGVALLLATSLASGELRGFTLWLLGPAGLGVGLSIWARQEAGPSLATKAARRIHRRLKR